MASKGLKLDNATVSFVTHRPKPETCIGCGGKLLKVYLTQKIHKFIDRAIGTFKHVNKKSQKQTIEIQNFQET